MARKIPSFSIGTSIDKAIMQEKRKVKYK